MPNDFSAISEGALEDISYLARSTNRVTLLEMLTSGPYTRRQLEDSTGVASTTVGRILNEFSDREWIKRTIDGEYVATPVGQQVVSEFIPLIESMDVIQKLGETVAWFQSTEVPIDVEKLTDTTVLRPDPADPIAPMNTYLEELRSADEFYCLVGIAPPDSFEKAMRNGVVDRGMQVEHIISEHEYRYLLDLSDRLARWREYLEAGANVFCYGGTVPCNVMIFDDTTYIANTQSEYGEPYTVIESDSDYLLSWGFDLIDKYRSESRKLTAKDFASDVNPAAPDDK